MEIIEVKNSDIHNLSEHCAAIYYANYADHWIDNDPSVYISEQYSTESLLEQLENNSKYYLAMNDNNVIGFMKLNFNRKSILDKNNKAIELEKIYFELGSQRHGYGSKLLRFVFNLADKEGYSEIQLDVSSANLKARNFYLKYGFVEHSDTELGHPLFKPEYQAMKIMVKNLV